MAMTDEAQTYEGWTNRETWAVALHINNDQGWQEAVHAAAREARDSDPDPQGNTRGMANRIGNVIRQNVFDALDPYEFDGRNAAYLADVLIPRLADIGSLWRVDWDEIGEAFLTDLDEQ